MPAEPVRAAAVVVAAGRGERLGESSGGAPKGLLPLLGRPLLALALDRVRAVAAITEVVVVHPPGEREAFAAHAGTATLVDGGATRSASVRAGVAAVRGDAQVIAIHDAARPLTPPQVIARVLDAITGQVVAAAPALPMADTLKRADASGRVEATVERSGLHGVQTPQAVRRDVLEVVLRWAEGSDATDDLALVEQAIAAGVVEGEVRVVAGHPLAMKVTRPEDLALAEMLGGGATVRVGSSVDVHAFAAEPRPLVLAGVEIEPTGGLGGHSDADVVAHALTDALLGAAGLGDMGERFGVGRPELAGADSIGLLALVRDELAQLGWRVGNADVTVVAQRPRLGPQRAQMIMRLADALALGSGAVSVKFTTTDRLGAIGRGEGIACWATCTLVTDRGTAVTAE